MVNPWTLGNPYWMQSTDCYKKMSSLIFFQILFCWEPHNYYQKDRSICTEVHLLSRGRHSGANGPADRPFNIFFARWCCLHVLLCLPNPRTFSPHLVFFILLSSPVDTLAWTVLLLPLVTTHHRRTAANLPTGRPIIYTFRGPQRNSADPLLFFSTSTLLLTTRHFFLVRCNASPFL